MKENIIINGQNVSLLGQNCSYIVETIKGRYPLNIHWGGKYSVQKDFKHPVYDERPYCINCESDRSVSDLQVMMIDDYSCEYGSAGRGDFRIPAFMITDARGYHVTGPFKTSMNKISEKPSIESMPYVKTQDKNADSVEILMEDVESGLLITLRYTILPEYDAIIRNAVFENRGTSELKINRAMSFSIDMPQGDYEKIHLSGNWARERHLCRSKVDQGTFSIGSTRGISSHQHNPFMALVHPDTTEHSGEAYGVALVYSGNFKIDIEMDPDGRIRFDGGINPDTFEWVLREGETFETPEAVMVYSSEGLNGMSDNFHRLVRECIFPERFAKKERPVLFNNWEATYFDFNEKVLVELAKKAASAGVELFVLDDGWFLERNSDKTSLGDWIVDSQKLPGGLNTLAEEIHKKGMKFGLWLEPEMISRKSRLFSEHPEWCIHIPDREPVEGRNQLVLDLTNSDVREYIKETVMNILSSAPVSYVKWDMNRYITDFGSSMLGANQQGEFFHRYVLGLYEIMNVITASFPDVLFEGCAGGGGRFDMGLLYFMPQYWTSDNTDAVSRIKIQYGTSLVFPPIAMGAHISEVPNHQVKRRTSLEMRGFAAMSGNFGLELDVSRMNDEEIDGIRSILELYKNHRPLIQFGKLKRLISPFEKNEAAWYFISEDLSEILLFRFALLNEANQNSKFLRIHGLPKGKIYKCEKDKRKYTSEELLFRGVEFARQKIDFEAHMLYFKEV